MTCEKGQSTGVVPQTEIGSPAVIRNSQAAPGHDTCSAAGQAERALRRPLPRRGFHSLRSSPTGSAASGGLVPACHSPLGCLAWPTAARWRHRAPSAGHQLGWNHWVRLERTLPHRHASPKDPSCELWTSLLARRHRSTAPASGAVQACIGAGAEPVLSGGGQISRRWFPASPAREAPVWTACAARRTQAGASAWGQGAVASLGGPARSTRVRDGVTRCICPWGWGSALSPASTFTAILKEGRMTASRVCGRRGPHEARRPGALPGARRLGRTNPRDSAGREASHRPPGGPTGRRTSSPARAAPTIRGLSKHSSTTVAPALRASGAAAASTPAGPAPRSASGNRVEGVSAHRIEREITVPGSISPVGPDSNRLRRRVS
jgi:hypothetical protein